MLRKKLALLMVWLCAVWLNASPFTVDGLNYEVYSSLPDLPYKTVALKGATSRSIESLSVPATVTYKGVEYYVDYIHPDAFDNYSGLRTVRFEDSSHVLQSIGSKNKKTMVWMWPTSPFQNCPIEDYYVGRNIIFFGNSSHQLVLESTAESVSITFAGQIGKLTKAPFYVHPATTSQLLPRLKSISIGGTITEISSGTFADAVNLESLTMLPGNTISLLSDVFAEGLVFDNVTVEEPNYTLFTGFAYTNLTLGSAYQTVPERMLYGHKSVKKVTLSEGITKIENSAFMGCDNLEEINFPSSLEEIDSYAFNECHKLGNVKLNEGLKKIGEASFQGCQGFDRIVIPGSVEEISQKGFYGSWNVNHILVEPSTEGNVLKMGNQAFGVYEVDSLILNRVVQHKNGLSYVYHFQDCLPLHLVFGEGWETIPEKIRLSDKILQTVSLPSTLRKIGNASFMGCDNLEEINFPSSLEEIDSFAFNECHKLGNVKLNEGLKKIGEASFQGCQGFDRIVIPGSVEEISQKGFYGCWNVNHILVEPSPEGTVLKMGDQAFGVYEVDSLILNRVVQHKNGLSYVYHLQDCLPLHLVFGEGWETIPEKIRLSDKILQTVSLPSTLRKIGNASFMGCDNLEEINFPSSLEEIDSFAFNECHKLGNVKLNEGLKKIGEASFQGCQGFDRIVIPGSVEEISQKGFYGCWNVNEILVEPSADGSVLKMGTEAFGVHEVESLELNRVVDHEYGPYSPLHLKSCSPRHVVFGEGWEIIRDSMMANRDSLRSVSLPASLVRIDGSAFAGCPKLEKVTVHAVEPPVCGSDNVFASEIFPVATLTVPTGSRALYQEAFVWMNFSNIAISGNAVVSVKYNDEGGSVALNGIDTDMLEVEQGDRLEVSVAPADGYELSKLTLNGNDALDRVTDGLLIIEEVLDSVEIEVAFDLTTGVNSVDRDSWVCTTDGGMIEVVGLPEGAEWQLYDIAGVLIYSGGAGRVAVAPGIYVVRVGTVTRRVMVH